MSKSIPSNMEVVTAAIVNILAKMGPMHGVHPAPKPIPINKELEYYPSGTSLKPEYKNDMVDMMQGDRGILEFTYNFPGMFMFHAHKTEFTMKGWMGMFNVTKPDERGLENIDLASIANTNAKNTCNSIVSNATQTSEASRVPTKTTTNDQSGNSNAGLIEV